MIRWLWSLRVRRVDDGFGGKAWLWPWPLSKLLRR